MDSREVSFTNKERIQKQIDLWGEDSDFIRVRWLGLFPSASTTQLIPLDYIEQSMRARPEAQVWEPLILGVDVARFGANKSVVAFRRGRDARSIPWKSWRGLSTTQLGQEVASLIAIHSPDAVFIDEGGVGGGVIDFLRHLKHSVIGVNFGAIPSIPLGGELAYNKRAEMYLSTRWWLGTGGAIPFDIDLKDQLVSIEYGYSKATKRGECIMLSPKEDLDESPDDADALVLTFAYPVSQRILRGEGQTQIKKDYDPLSFEALTGQKPSPRVFPKGFVL